MLGNCAGCETRAGKGGRVEGVEAGTTLSFRKEKNPETRENDFFGEFSSFSGATLILSLFKERGGWGIA